MFFTKKAGLSRRISSTMIGSINGTGMLTKMAKSVTI
jgi:hypothetical protein